MKETITAQEAKITVLEEENTAQKSKINTLFVAGCG